MKKQVLPGMSFSFKGITLTTGDIVAFISKSLPVEMQAAFTDVTDDGNMHVFSTLLVPFQHNGCFTSDDILEIKVVKSAKEAVSVEARNKSLYYGQEVKTAINDENVVCTIIAAFDGIVSYWSEIRKDFVTGGSKYFEPV